MGLGTKGARESAQERERRTEGLWGRADFNTEGEDRTGLNVDGAGRGTDLDEMGLVTDGTDMDTDGADSDGTCLETDETDGTGLDGKNVEADGTGLDAGGTDVDGTNLDTDGTDGTATGVGRQERRR